MVASRLALSTSRAALRRVGGAYRAPRVPSHQARFNSSSSSSSSSNHSALQKSDAPWAIASAVVFGSLFVYATSPASKTHNEHGHVVGGKKPAQHGAGSAKSDDRTGDDAVWKLEGGGEDKQEQTKDPEEEGEDAPEGNKHLANHAASKEAPQQKSPSSQDRDPSNETSGKENSNFASGIKHSKDGDPVSDPKRVVAAANAAKQDKKASKEAEAEGKEGEADEGKDDE